MNADERNREIPDTLQECFLDSIQFVSAGTPVDDRQRTVTVQWLPTGETDIDGLESDTLPFLSVPEDHEPAGNGRGRLALVAVEGRDNQMAKALEVLLEPNIVGIGLMHVTWLPAMISSPLEESGLDNPEPADLLAYQGAREALIDTSNALRRAGFDVSTHLREDRDPAEPLATTIRRQHPDLFILGLGRHGAGIGRRVLARVSIPVLYVRAR